jgi:phosphoglucosamine mutase
MKREHFGTDGIRGRVGRAPMTPDFVLRLGRAAGRVLAPHGRGLVLIGKDTRISGYMFESALEAGLAAAGVDVRLLGPLPTPGIAFLTRALRADAGFVISASHNPFHDNGIKLFSREGKKLADELELAIERELGQPFATVESRQLGKAERVDDAAGRYIEHCKASVPGGFDLKGLRVAVDCAHGAGYLVAPRVLSELGATVFPIGVEPDGFNINDGVGSTAPDLLQRTVIEHDCDVGLALDGDGDRVLMVDRRGELCDGDDLVYVIAAGRRDTGHLAGPVVGTLMSNLGLERALAARGIAFRRAAVGDRHVLAMLEAEGGTIGGEPSGHILCLDRTTTGDGIVAALQVLERVVATGRTLGELRAPLVKLPQTLVNVRVAARVDLADPEIAGAVAAAERALAARGRVLLRASGTEPLVRVMVEGDDEHEVARHAEALAAVVRERAGAV